jgi:uncharacterized membrane protein YhaH (DUF805 family)
MYWYFEALRKYADFSGRARRREYWVFTLISAALNIGLVVADVLIGTYDEESGFGLLSAIYALAFFLPSLAVTVRRLHDTDRSGWWMLIYFAPCVGGIVLLLFLVSDSTPGENRYGPSPKEIRWDVPPPPPSF